MEKITWFNLEVTVKIILNFKYVISYVKWNCYCCNSWANWEPIWRIYFQIIIWWKIRPLYATSYPIHINTMESLYMSRNWKYMLRYIETYQSWKYNNIRLVSCFNIIISSFVNNIIVRLENYTIKLTRLKYLSCCRDATKIF